MRRVLIAAIGVALLACGPRAASASLETPPDITLSCATQYVNSQRQENVPVSVEIWVNPPKLVWNNSILYKAKIEANVVRFWFANEQGGEQGRIDRTTGRFDSEIYFGTQPPAHRDPAHKVYLSGQCSLAPRPLF
jgi:hypothetical protein